MGVNHLACAAIAAMIAGACSPKSDTYTLYRNSPVASDMRIHIATFDASERAPSYNRENCELAASLFNGQAGVQSKFWCERGKYNP